MVGEKLSTALQDATTGRPYPHLRTLDLPLVSVAFVSSPFGLEEVEDARERVVLAALRGEGNFRRLGPLLLLRTRGCLLLLLLG